MNRIPFLSFFLLLVVLLSNCAGNSSSENGEDDTEMGLRPQGREASRNDSTIASLLSDICGMKFSEAMKVDDYYDRIGTDEGLVSEGLSKGSAVFSREENGYCVAKSEAEAEESLIHFIMVLDIQNDVVSAAKYEVETGMVQSWTEEKDGTLPDIINEWLEEMELGKALPEPAVDNVND
jgi:hypothetical protein